MSDHSEIMTAIARVEGHCLRLDEHLDRLEEVSVKRLDNHAKRVDSLESTRDNCKGAMKVFAALVTAVGALAVWFQWFK